MRLDELRLTAFGRYRGASLTLRPGLNVLFGPNEAGKSTIHRFIQGMLYGFAKPGLKRKIMLPEYESCRPWQGEEYAGMLMLTTDGGRQFRMERDFARQRVQVYDSQTGASIGLSFDSREQPTFATELLGLSQEEFGSTVAIGQLEVARLPDGQGKSLADRMAALQVSGREDESAHRAIRYLDKRMDDVGTERAKITTPLGAAAARQISLLEERDRVRRRRSENLRREMEIQRMTAELEWLTTGEETLRQRIARAEAQGLSARLERLSRQLEDARTEEQRAGDLQRKLDSLQPVAGLNPSITEQAHAWYEAYVEAQQARDRSEALIRGQQETVDRLRGELARYTVPGDPAELEMRAEGLQAEIDRIQAQASARAMAAPSSGPTMLWAAALTLLALAIVLGILVSPWAFLLGLGAAPLLLQALRSGTAPPSDAVPIQAELSGCKANLQELLTQCGVASIGELKAKVRLLTTTRAQLEGAQRSLEDVRRQADSIRDPAEILARLLAPMAEVAVCREPLQRAVAERTITRETLREFTDLIQSFRADQARLKQAMDRAQAAWSRAEEEASALIDEGHLWAEPLRSAARTRDGQAAQAALAAARTSLPSGPNGSGEIRSAAELQTERDRVQGTIQELTRQVSALAGAVAQTYAELPDLAELERKLEAESSKVERLRLERRALERAKQVISEVAEEMHRDFAPRLAARVGPVIARVTRGRYTDVRINDHLDLTTEVPETHEFKSVRALSSGAADQFYFTLRICAALELSAGAERPPILCDDSLVQYDDDRALACLEYLAELGQEYQVVLMTCHQREVAAARALGAHVVSL